MAKYIVGAVVIILILGGAYYMWEKQGAATPPPSPVPQGPQLITYASSTLGAGISIMYPDDFTIDELYAYEGFPGKPIAGVKFTIPATLATGTNLAPDSYIAIEVLPRAKTCTGDIFVTANVRAEDIPTGTILWSLATSSEGAAGNLYEEQMYAIKDSKPCLGVRYVIRSSTVANYEPGTVTEFDRFSLLSKFDAIRDSLMKLSDTATTTSSFE